MGDKVESKPKQIPRYGTEIVTVSSPEGVMTKQKIPYFLGISKATTGAKTLSMNLVVIPAGACADPHYHRDFETGIYIMQGSVETRYGEGLKHSVINEAGDFVFIPPDLPHQPFNLSDSESAIAIVVRSDADEQENVVLYEANKDI
jgi:uncharacterized RmlC-like cupin family protein